LLRRFRLRSVINSSQKEIRMKRLHVHSSVADLDSSIRFYSTLFGAGPSVVKPDYAKWMLDDPRVNFAISTGQEGEKGVRHLGIQAESLDELGQVYGQLRAADRPVLEEGRTTCCYAKSEKSWISDPDGLVWEAFYTDGEATTYGDSPELGTLGDSVPEAACCVPAGVTAE
jgi:catechol 2,3-dioxygenase-like lactoylglutathione lyase family enzyme